MKRFKFLSPLFSIPFSLEPSSPVHVEATPLSSSITLAYASIRPIELALFDISHSTVLPRQGDSELFSLTFLTARFHSYSKVPGFLNTCLLSAHL